MENKVWCNVNFQCNHLRQWTRDGDPKPVVANIWEGYGKHKCHTCQADASAKS